MIKHTKKSEITIEQDEQTKNFLFLIEGVYYQQKGCKTEQEAMEEGKKKLKKILDYK